MQAISWTIPRHDAVRYPGRPWVTYALMLAILVVMCVEIAVARSSSNLESFFNSFGLVSSEFQWSNPAAYIPLFTFNFLHSGGEHFAGNAIVMLFACASVERHAGRRATLFVWVIGGVVAGAAHLFVMPDTARSLVGASGAISAMIGAAFIIGWRWALPVRFRRGGRTFFSIPLPAVVAIWVAFQAFSFIQVEANLMAGSSVATWVHLAGFTFGVLVAGVLSFYRLRDPAKPSQPEYSLAGD